MSLKKQIDDKLNQALKAKDKNTYPTLRLIVSAIKDAEIAGRSKGQKELKDSDIISLLKKMVKQRNESCEVYEKAGRKELLENEKKEIEVISNFLPKQLVFNIAKITCGLSTNWFFLCFEFSLAIDKISRTLSVNFILFMSIPGMYGWLYEKQV